MHNSKMGIKNALSVMAYVFAPCVLTILFIPVNIGAVFVIAGKVIIR